MDLYARVNILGGRSVRLPHGDLSGAIPLDNDPVGRAQAWVAQGADHIHVVDLDAAAYDDYVNRPLIDRLVQSVDAPVQVAGGVRSDVEAARLIEAGAWRVVLGTAAIEHQNMVWDLCRDHPDKIAVSLDVHADEEIVTRGWTKHSGRYLEEVLIELSSAGVASFLVAEAGRDALSEPPDFRLLAEALATVDEPVIAAGGVRDLADLRRLLALTAGGRRLAGVIVGREVTHGRITIPEALEVIAAGAGEDEEPDAEATAAPSPVSISVAGRYQSLAEELDRAAAHARVAAQHHLTGEVPRGPAHGFSVEGHLVRARRLLDEIAEVQAEHSRPVR
jgi:phosphoribosylformimino-5-aminoimidazole carboxamide ribotide isomerase